MGQNVETGTEWRELIVMAANQRMLYPDQAANLENLPNLPVETVPS